jgi:hypothetical protein
MAGSSPAMEWEVVLRSGSDGTVKAKGGQIEAGDESTYSANQNFRCNIVVNAGRQQTGLIAV